MAHHKLRSFISGEKFFTGFVSSFEYYQILEVSMNGIIAYMVFCELFSFYHSFALNFNFYMLLKFSAKKICQKIEYIFIT